MGPCLGNILPVKQRFSGLLLIRTTWEALKAFSAKAANLLGGPLEWDSRISRF